MRPADPLRALDPRHGPRAGSAFGSAAHLVLHIRGWVLVNHHAIAKNGKVHFGLLKTAFVDAQGTLRLRWWKGNERLKHRRIDVPRLERPQGSPSMYFADEFPAGGGFILEGGILLPTDASPDPRGFDTHRQSLAVARPDGGPLDRVRPHIDRGVDRVAAPAPSAAGRHGDAEGATSSPRIRRSTSSRRRAPIPRRRRRGATT